MTETYHAGLRNVAGIYATKHPNRETIVGAMIRDQRTRLRISQSQLARMIDVDHSMVSRIESGDRRPSIDLLYQIADALEIPMTDLALAVCDVDPGEYREAIRTQERERVIEAFANALQEAA